MKKITLMQRKCNGNSLFYRMGFWVSMLCMVTSAGMCAVPVKSGLVGHFDATNIDGFNNATLSDGGDVTNWNNVATTDNAVAVGDAPTFQTGAVNGLPTVRFNGDDALRINGLTVSELTDATFFLVAKSASLANNYALSCSDISHMRYNLGTVVLSSQPGWSFAMKTTDNNQETISANRWSDYNIYRVIGARYDDDEVGDDDGNQQDLFVAGDLFSQTISAGVTIADNDLTLQLGARGGASLEKFFTGDISEVLIYNRAVTEAERREIEVYLSAKYNTSVSPGLKLYYSFDDPDSTTPTDVTDGAIGKDGSIALYGTASSSFNTDVPAAIGNGKSLQLTANAGVGNGAFVKSSDISPYINFNSDNWTVSTWFKRRNDATRDREFIFHIGSGDAFGADNEMYLMWDLDSDRIVLWNYPGTTSPDIAKVIGYVVQDVWAHVAVVRSGSLIEVYLNGELAGSDSSFTLNLDSSKLAFGGHWATVNYDRGLDGSLDDCAVWNRALDVETIQLLAQGLTTPLTTEPPPPPPEGTLIIVN